MTSYREILNAVDLIQELINEGVLDIYLENNITDKKEAERVLLSVEEYVRDLENKESADEDASND